MPQFNTGHCGLGDRCLKPSFQIREIYKCYFCGLQLHSEVSGCSRKHGEDGEDGEDG